MLYSVERDGQTNATCGIHTWTRELLDQNIPELLRKETLAILFRPKNVSLVGICAFKY